jgi:hypothetical protein
MSLEILRRWLRGRRLWVQFQELNREGWLRAWRRRRIQRQILTTPPFLTAREGPVEVRVLTWRRDWVSLIWTLKSFYHFAGVDYPLYVHDGGMSRAQAERLLAHFPNATFLPEPQAGDAACALLEQRGFRRSAEYRRKNPAARKLFDFYLFSTAETVLTIDSDVVFFRRPDEILVRPEALRNNLYNEDEAYWYSVSLDEMERSFGVRPPPRINSGLALVRRSSIDFAAIERWLEHPALFADRWVTEQTLHALCSTVHGVELLPPAYRVGGDATPSDGLVCKHYAGVFRPQLYEEGMRHLQRTGFLDALRDR